MGKRASFLDKYWFAVGYHSKLVNEDYQPNPMVVDYLKENHGVDVSQSYQDGVSMAAKDKEKGNV